MAPETVSALVGAGSALLGAALGGWMTYWTAKQSNRHQAEQERIARELAQLEKLNEIIAAITKHLAEVEVSGARVSVPELASFPRARLLIEICLPNAKGEFDMLMENFGLLGAVPFGVGVNEFAAEKARSLANEIDNKIIQRFRDLSVSK